MHAKTPAQRERAEALSVMLFAIAGLIAATAHTVFRAMEIFRDGGIYWTLPIDRTEVSASVSFGAGTVDGVAHELTVFATNVNGLSVAAAVGTLAVWLCVAVLIIGAIMTFARNALRSEVFVQSNVRAISIVSVTLAFGAVLIFFCEKLATNGIARAAGLGEDVTFYTHMNWIAYAAAIAVGLLAHTIRRGIQLQNDTTGLV